MQRGSSSEELAAFLGSRLSRLVWSGGAGDEAPPRAPAEALPLFHDLSVQVQAEAGGAVVRVQLAITYGISIPDVTAFIYPYLVRWVQEALPVEQVQVHIDVEDLWFPAEPDAAW